MSDILDENSEISNINLDTEMRQSYLDYAMSVIVSRALPCLLYTSPSPRDPM